VASVLGARDLFRLVRRGVDVRAVQANVRKPFRFLLCGDSALVAELRTLLLSGHDDRAVPLDAAATLETIGAGGAPLPSYAKMRATEDARAVIWLGHRTELATFDPSVLRPLRLPILAITVDAEGEPCGPAKRPDPGSFAEYVVPSLSREALRGRVFPHLVECARGVEIAVGRRLPALRESVAAKLTRDAAKNALKVALASAVVDHIPGIGIVLGAFASAGDMIAITGIQMMLLLHIEAAYGRDPDLQRMWQLLPVIGSGFGWRALARELSGFVPIAGIPIKGAIAFAGTLVVGEGVTFFLEHGRHMTKGQASAIYDKTKKDALQTARDFIGRFKKN
jgi:uncharacterized protein (DUF697 family)